MILAGNMDMDSSSIPVLAAGAWFGFVVGASSGTCLAGLLAASELSPDIFAFAAIGATSGMTAGAAGAAVGVKMHNWD